MKKLLTILLVIILLSTNTYAFDLNLKDTAHFIGGAVSAYMIHEGGHYLAAEITDTDIDARWFEGNQIVLLYMEPESRKEGAYICSAGLITQAICSEMILDMKASRDNAFIHGMMFWNILNPIMYAADYWWIHRSHYIDERGFQGDLHGVEYYSDKKTANVFAGTMVLLAIWHGYRFYSEEDIMFKNFNIAPINVKHGAGLQFTYKF